MTLTSQVAWSGKRGGGGSGGTTSCKGPSARDLKIDSPYKIISLKFTKAKTFEVVLSQGADSNGISLPNYSLKDMAGNEVAHFPSGDTPFSHYFDLDVFFSGLVPGESYRLEIPSYDYCTTSDGSKIPHNTYVDSRVITVPALPVPELNPPVVTSLQQQVFGGIGGMVTTTGLKIYAHDDTYVLSSQWLIDGVPYSTRRFDFPYAYMASSGADAEGFYYFWYNCSGPIKKQLVTNILTDVFGNQTTSSEWWDDLPTCP